jgi:hypothetical protein
VGHPLSQVLQRGSQEARNLAVSTQQSALSQRAVTLPATHPDSLLSIPYPITAITRDHGDSGDLPSGSGFLPFLRRHAGPELVKIGLDPLIAWI